MQCLEESSVSLECRAWGSSWQLWQGFMQRIIFRLPSQIKSRAPGVVLITSKSRRGRCSNSVDVLDQKTTITQYTSWCLFFHDVWVNFLGFIVGLISRCCSRRALVERSLCLEWLTMFFPTSSIPAILFLNLRKTHCRWPLPKHILRPELFNGGSVLAAWKWTLHCYNFVVLDGESNGRLRKFLRTCSPVWLPICARKTTSPSKRIKSSSPPKQSSHSW